VHRGLRSRASCYALAQMATATAVPPPDDDGAPWSMQRLALDEVQLCALAERLGAALCAGDVVLLVGEMGAGKTTFTRALARGLGVARPDRVCSPTFNVRIEHRGPIPLVHVDLCRLVELGGDDESEGPSAAFEALGLDDWPMAGDAGSALVVEWADAWQKPPADHLRITLTPCRDAPDRRDVAMTGRGRPVIAADAAVRAV